MQVACGRQLTVTAGDISRLSEVKGQAVSSPFFFLQPGFNALLFPYQSRRFIFAAQIPL